MEPDVANESSLTRSIDAEGAADATTPGPVADRFELLAFAASGGMGDVYRARDRTTGAIVAVKLLSRGPSHVRRFEREAGVLSRIDHPGVVRYVAHGETGNGKHYLAMEWLAGEDLSDRLGAEGSLGIADTLTIAKQAAEALAVAHRAGVVHRDLKPANLFLVDRRFDRLKVLDFGIARTV